MPRPRKYMPKPVCIRLEESVYSYYMRLAAERGTTWQEQIREALRPDGA